MTEAGVDRVRVFVVCPGLGHVNRGYETFARECFDALRADGRLELRLYKGAGESGDRERVVPCLKRTRLAARAISLFNNDMYAAYGPYYVEQTSFTLSLIPRLLRRRPDVVLLSDPTVGHLLWRWKRLTGMAFKLLLSNGGPIGPPDFPRFDHVHQVSRMAYDESARAHRPPSTQTLIAYGFKMSDELKLPNHEEQERLRERLGLPQGRPIVLSVGALNRSHKRMDYLVREVAALSPSRPFLVMLGSEDFETPSVRSVAAAALGPDGYRMASVPMQSMADYYRAADVFALASLSEGFGRAYVEAMSYGLPCVVHDGPVQHEVLGEHGFYADARSPAAFAARIGDALTQGADGGRERHRFVYDRFSWDRLTPRYVDMISTCARTSPKSIRNKAH